MRSPTHRGGGPLAESRCRRPYDPVARTGKETIRRHVLGVVEALLAHALDDGVTYVLYCHEGLPVPQFTESERKPRRDASASTVFLPCCDDRRLVGAKRRRARRVPGSRSVRPSARPRTAAQVSGWSIDLCLRPGCLAVRTPGARLPDAVAGERLYRHLERLRSYDCLVAANEATSSDLQRLLGCRLRGSWLRSAEGIAPSAAKFLVEALIHPPPHGQSASHDSETYGGAAISVVLTVPSQRHRRGRSRR